MGIRDFGRYSIPFGFNGSVIILKVTKFSTCDDVIHMILHKVGLPVSELTLYVMCERTHSTERMLPGKSLVYQVWRTRDRENRHSQFVIKSKNTTLGIKNKDTTLGIKNKDTTLGFKRTLSSRPAECDTDELFLEQYNRKAETSGIVSKEESNEKSNGIKSVSFNMENKKTQMVRSEEVSTNKSSVASGKHMLLKRYLYDMFTRADKKRRNQTQFPTRELGDTRFHIRELWDTQFPTRDLGDMAERENPRRGGGSASSVALHGNTFHHETCNHLYERYYTPDSESDSDDTFSDTSSQVEISVHGTRAGTLDTAFIKSSRDSDIDEGIDVTSVHSTDLDTAFISEDNHEYETTSVDKYVSNAAGKHDRSTQEESCLQIVSEFEMNISDDKFVKGLFVRAGTDMFPSEDDEMDSFMRTRLDSI